MKTFMVVAISLFLVGNSVNAQVTKEFIYDRITRYSAIYGVSEGLMTHIVVGESSLRSDVVGDQHLTCKKTGNPMRSRGLVQISDCYWDISDEDAFDVDFALDFLARKLSEGMLLKIKENNEACVARDNLQDFEIKALTLKDKGRVGYFAGISSVVSIVVLIIGWVLNKLL
jgi:hypothetical protein